jgi:hypothetical protein
MYGRYLLTLVVAIAVAWPMWAADAHTTARVFQLRYISVMEASQAIQPLLSSHGSLTVHPGQARITVQDTPEVVARAADLLAGLDRSPKSYRIHVTLMQGTNQPLKENRSAEVDRRLKKMFPFDGYRRIGETVFEGTLGTPVSADLGEGFRLSFLPTEFMTSDDQPFGIRGASSRLHLQSLNLERTSEGAGGQRVSVEVMRTSVLMSPKQEAFIGAGASEDSNSGLVLILSAQSIGDR